MKSKLFPPVVAVLGHVDHGKTTLLDAIRKTNVAQREHGGITQSIGAYQVETVQEGKKHKITFIDTPGHEAFLKMRSRGAQASDIALLIIDSSSGVRPQTEESIRHIKDAKVPFLVVLTKADLKTVNPQKVKQQLVKAGVSLEGLGGDTPIVSVSAKEGRGLKELLEMIILLSEVNAISKDDSLPFSGMVIESRLDPNSGPLVSLIVKSGTLSVGDSLLYEGEGVKVRALISYDQKRLKKVFPGDPVEVLGFPRIVPVGTLIQRAEMKVSGSVQIRPKEVPAQRPTVFPEKGVLPVILKTDKEGSLEALIHSIPAEMEIIDRGTGLISEGDVLLAKSTKAIILGFNTKAASAALRLAKTEGVIIKTYTIIYELLEDLEEALASLKQGKKEIIGKGEVVASFPFNNGKILGVRMIDGYFRKGMQVELVRKEEKIGRATISSLRQGKVDKNRVDKNQECGMILSPFLDFSLGDMLLSYS